MLQKGAEAELFETEFMGAKALLKKRVPKAYRVKELDEELRVQRTRKEAKLLVEAKEAGVRTPLVYSVHPKKGILLMEFLEGLKLKDALNEANCAELCAVIGRDMALMHEAAIIHGDLTTSNMVLMQGSKVGYIDFGLGKTSDELEERAVDLLNFKKTFSATHFKLFDKGWKALCKAYEAGLKDGKKVTKHVLEVEKRVRYAS